MKLKPSHQRAMALITAVLLLALFIAFLGGLAYLIIQILKALDKIDQSHKKQNQDGLAPIVQQLSQEDLQTVSNIVHSSDPAIVMSNWVSREANITVEFSTNLLDWEPWTNVLDSEGNFLLPIQTDRGPNGFYRMRTSK